MKRENLKKTLSIIAVTLFSLSIIGGIVLSIIFTKRDTASAAVAVQQSQVRYSAGLDPLSDTIVIEDFDEIFINNPKDYGTYNDINGYQRVQSYWTNLDTNKPLLIGDILDWSVLLVNNDPQHLYYGEYISDQEIHFYPVGSMQPYEVPDFGWFGGILGVFLYYYNPDNADSYNQGYEDGYNDGYLAGDKDGYDVGFQEGRRHGRGEGYSQGYNDGLLAGMEDADTALLEQYELLQDDYERLYDLYTDAVDDLDEYRSLVADKNNEIFNLRLRITYLELMIKDLQSQLENSQGGGSGDYNQGFKDGYDSGLYDGYSQGYVEGGRVGYDNGYQTGHKNGYESGYLAGLNKAQSDSLKNPVSYILTPVHEFMNMNLFGVVSLGTIFNILLFVSVALIFIKMFSGG